MVPCDRDVFWCLGFHCGYCWRIDCVARPRLTPLAGSFSLLTRISYPQARRPPLPPKVSLRSKEKRLGVLTRRARRAPSREPVSNYGSHSELPPPKADTAFQSPARCPLGRLNTSTIRQGREPQWFSCISLSLWSKPESEKENARPGRKCSRGSVGLATAGRACSCSIFRHEERFLHVHRTRPH